jgi:plasmid stability protein
MAVLNIRNLPDHIHDRLRLRAAKARRSMEAEAREILIAACTAPQDRLPPTALQELVDDLYRKRRPKGVVRSLIRERRRAARNE